MKKILITGFRLLILTIATPLFAQDRGLTLSDILSKAAQGNRTLQIHALELKRSDDLVMESRSGLLPSVRFQSSYMVFGNHPVIYLRDETATPRVNDVRYGGRLAFDAHIAAEYALVNPIVKTAVQSSSLNQKAVRLNQKAAEEELAVELSRLYYTILFYDQQKQVLLQSINRNEQALNDSRNLFLQGKNLKTDTLSHSIDLKNLMLSVSTLENQIRIAKLQLKQLMGMDDSTDIQLAIDLSSDIQDRQVPQMAALTEHAMQNRPDINIAALNIEKSGVHIEQLKSVYKPQLTAFAMYQLQSQADDFRFGNYSLPATSLAGVRLSIPLYSGNRRKHQIAAASIEEKQKQLELADLQKKTETEIIALTLKINEEYNQLQIRQENVTASAVNFQMIRERYRAGLSTRLELADAELALTKAKLEEVRLKYNIKILEISLQKSSGLLSLNPQ